MGTEATNITLRKRLEGITETAQSDAEYLTMLAAVQEEYPNTIRVVDSPSPIRRYTCMVHVFDFIEKPEYTQIASRGFGVVYAGPKFAHWLLENEVLTEVAEGEARKGDLVFYFSQDSRIKHAGLNLGNGRVESKWGLGHLFQHGIFEVPEDYGHTVKFFRKLPYEEALECFKRFAREQGFIFLE